MSEKKGRKYVKQLLQYEEGRLTGFTNTSKNLKKNVFSRNIFYGFPKMSTLREKDSLSEETMSATTLFLFFKREFCYYILFGAFRNQGNHYDITKDNLT